MFKIERLLVADGGGSVKGVLGVEGERGKIKMDTEKTGRCQSALSFGRISKPAVMK